MSKWQKVNEGEVSGANLWLGAGKLPPQTTISVLAEDGSLRTWESHQNLIFSFYYYCELICIFSLT